MLKNLLVMWENLSTMEEAIRRKILQKTKVRFSLICLLSLTFINTFSQRNSSKEACIQLFNGKDLTGWDIKITGYDLNENFGNTFHLVVCDRSIHHDYCVIDITAFDQVII